MTGGAVPRGATLAAVDRATVYRRQPAPDGVDEVRRRTVDRLCDLRARGRIDEVRTEVWDDLGGGRDGSGGRDDSGSRDRNDVTSPGGQPSVPALVRSFEDWALAHDRSLHPAFRRVIAEAADGERREALEPPLLCLALYGADELAAVYPHCEGSVVHTVSDGLDALGATAEESVA